MSTTTQSKQPKRSRARKARRSFAPHKPHGVLAPRVQAVGPEHFGVVSVDCGKHCSDLMLCDFYGNLLLEPTNFEHTKMGFAIAIAQIREAAEKHHLKDLVIAVERAGNYHLPVKRAFSAAGFECRIVHPFATKSYRQPANPGNKTEPTDMAAIFRAATNGFGLIEQPLEGLWQQLRLFVRHRRDLVRKRSMLCCQIREHLEACLPGYAALFDDLWDCATAIPMARRFASAEAIRAAGVEGLLQALRETGVRSQRSCLTRVVAWTNQAALPDAEAPLHHQIFLRLDDDRVAKTAQITALEGEIARLLVQTPYVLLLTIVGINVVSAGEFAGEMGPITHYANAKAITGRAGLFPSRSQSGRIDHANGPLIRCANRSLRAALMMVADNLLKCNQHFKTLAETWRNIDQDARGTRVKIAVRFSRIGFHMVSGQEVFHHPSLRDRDYLIEKLIKFHQEHGTPADRILANLQHAVDQLPKTAYAEEAVPLIKLLEETRAVKRRGPQQLGDLLPLVLAKLGAGALQSTASGERDPD